MKTELFVPHFHGMLKLFFSIFILSNGLVAQMEMAEDSFFTAKGMVQDQLYDLAADQLRDFISSYPNHAYA